MSTRLTIQHGILLIAALLPARHAVAQRNAPTLLQPPTVLQHAEKLLDLAFSPDGKLLATASMNRPVSLWNPATGQLLRTLSEVARPASVAFSPDGKVLAASDPSGAVKSWNTQTWAPLSASLIPPAGPNPGLSFGCLPIRKTGTLGALASTRTVIAAWTAFDARVFELPPNGRAVQLYVLRCSTTAPDPSDTYTPRVHSVRFARSGLTAVMVCDHRVHLVDAATGVQQEFIAAPLVADAALSADGRFLANVRHEVNDAPQVHVRVLAQGAEYTFAPPPPSPGYQATAFSPDAAVLATSQWPTGAIVLWTLATRKVLRTLTGHTSFVRSLAFSPDGTILASNGGLDKTVRLWKMR